MNRLFLLTLLLLVSACTSTEPVTTEAPTVVVAEPPAAPAPDAMADAMLPISDDVRIDTLANGLVYYIRRNTEPANRAELRLAIDAGSVLEDDSQRGLAHFLEHMLFNGTERFEEQALIDFLERTGMRFGPDINAYTSFDETVYMLQVPTDSADVMQKALDVLEDWASAATLSDEEIEKERGVVLEEWRLSDQNASGRIRDQILPVLLADSRYEKRLPIGDTTIINNAPPEELRRFYRTWYRPDLMAVVAVGDFDVDGMERLIRENFSSLTNPADPTPRPSFEVPGHKQTLYKVATDPEYPSTVVQVNFKLEPEPLSTVADYREQIVSGLFNAMLNKRFAEISRQGDAPFLGAGVSKGGFVRTSAFYSLGAQVVEDSLLTGLDALLTEAARVRQHGFTETELARQKQEVLRAYERAYNDRENLESGGLAGEYVNNFLEGEPIPGIVYEYELVQRLMPQITLTMVNKQAAALLSDENRVVLVTMPEKAGLTPPTEADLAGVIAAVEQKPIAAYEDAVTDEPLIREVPAPAAVTNTRTVDELGVTEITLANGVRVVMKPTNFKEDEVRFSAFSPGGSSLYSDAEDFTASQAASLVARSGLGAFDRTALQKKLSGKVASVSPYIGELEEGLGGSASPQDLETLFQLIHLQFTAPRADSIALVAYQNQQRSFLQNRSLTPGSAFQDSLIAALYGDNPRRQVPTLNQVNTLDLAEAYRIYQDRFADAGDFTFIFVGNFETDQLTNLAQTYLGTLPATGRQETWRDVAPDLPEGVVQTAAYKGADEQSQVALVFNGPFDYARENRHLLRSLEGVVNIKLREELREERAGVYSTAVQSSTTDRPDETYQFIVFFGCAPDRVEELVDAVFAEIEEIKTNGVSADYLDKVKEQQRRERETSLEENSFWVGTLDFYYGHPSENILDILTYGDLIENINEADIQAAARQYLNEDRFVQVVLYPAAKAAE